MRRLKAVVDYRDILRELNKIESTIDHRRLFEVFGQRYVKAWTALKEKRVKRYVFKPRGLVLWIVVGKDREYLLYPAVGFCSCDDFFFAVMEGKAQACHHAIAQRLVSQLGWFDTVEAEDRLLDTFMKEWKGR